MREKFKELKEEIIINNIGYVRKDNANIYPYVKAQVKS